MNKRRRYLAKHRRATRRVEIELFGCHSGRAIAVQHPSRMNAERFRVYWSTICWLNDWPMAGA